MLLMELKHLHESVSDLPELALRKASVLSRLREVPLVSVKSSITWASHIGAWKVGALQVRAVIKLFPPQD